MTSESDPKNLIRESYRIEGITASECRSIFVDWALSVSGDPQDHLARLVEQYLGPYPDHPMTLVIKEGLASPSETGRRGGRAARVGQTRGL